MKGSSPRADWLSFEEARRRILDLCAPLAEEEAPLEEATGRALAGDLVARVDHPPWDNSAMDGFAVRAADVAGASEERPVVLPVSDDVPAGSFPESPLRPGTAVRVMTGAPVPAGATGVVRVEHTDGGRDGRVAIRAASDAERNIRRAGEDVRRGEPILPAGSEITPAVVGLLAMNGIRRARCRRRPRIAILANGDELADFDQVEEALAGRKIMNSNSWALAAQVRTAGGIPVPLGIARDDRASVRRRLEGWEACDALVSSAGVSVGEHDLVRKTLEEMGMRRAFWRARIRPGSPLTVGVLDGRPVWGLPGNPVSALVTFEIFLRPALRRMAGHARELAPTSSGRAAERIESVRDLTHFYRARVERVSGSLPDVRLTGPQGSGILTSMATADALAVIPEGVEVVEPGGVVELLPVGG